MSIVTGSQRCLRGSSGASPLAANARAAPRASESCGRVGRSLLVVLRCLGGCSRGNPLQGPALRPIWACSRPTSTRSCPGSTAFGQTFSKFEQHLPDIGQNCYGIDQRHFARFRPNLARTSQPEIGLPRPGIGQHRPAIDQSRPGIDQIHRPNLTELVCAWLLLLLPMVDSSIVTRCARLSVHRKPKSSGVGHAPRFLRKHTQTVHTVKFACRCCCLCV